MLAILFGCLQAAGWGAPDSTCGPSPGRSGLRSLYWQVSCQRVDSQSISKSLLGLGGGSCLSAALEITRADEAGTHVVVPSGELDFPCSRMLHESTQWSADLSSRIVERETCAQAAPAGVECNATPARKGEQPPALAGSDAYISQSAWLSTTILRRAPRGGASTKLS